jgi:cellulose synthase (UDP-forming)
MAALLAGAVWGLNRIYYVRQPVAALSVNVLWCLYNVWLLLTVLYFNRPEEIRSGVSVFADDKVHV